MNPALVKKICEVAKNRDIVVQFVSEYERWISQPINEDAQHYFDVYFEKIPEIRGYNGENISGVLLFNSEEEDEAIIKEIDHPGLDVFRLFPYAIDIREHVIRKSDGIKKVLDFYNISSENALAMGDDVQDIPMFEMCKYSVAMGNSNPLAKNAAKFVTYHIDKHGVRRALKHLKVI